MKRVKVKICGIRTLEEAEAAISAGAYSLGFNFWPRSARYVEPLAVQEFIKRLSPLISTVGVFVDEDANRIMSIASQLGLQAIQLHGDESPEFCELLKSIKTIKAFRVSEDFDLSVINKYHVDMALLDSNVNGRYGGTGQRFDWRIAVEAKKLSPIILAGGLTLENVGEAIKQVQPDAIDVCSGVEAEPGRKDFDKIQKFMNIVTQANALIAGDHDTRSKTNFI